MEQKKKTGKKLGIALAVTIPVLILAAFVGTYFFTYSSAGKALDRRDHEEAKKLLFLKDATKLHDPNIIKYIEALETEANGDHETAIDLFRALGDYKESDTIQKEIRYRLAEEKRGAGSYDEACGIFAALRGEGYGDSADQVILTKLKKAEALVESGSFEEAIEVLNELSDNEGRDTTEEINEVNYKKATALLEEGKFEDALKLFTALSELEYKDSADMILETRYRQGDKAEEDGNLNAAFIAFRKLYFESDYKDSHERYLRVRYKTALGEVEEDPLGSLRKFRQLVREGYEDAEKGVVIAKEAIMRLTEEGSDDFFYFWEEEYKNHAGDSDYDYFLLSIHNYVVKDTAEFEMCPFAEMPFDSSISGYFETIGDFYDALRQSAFGDRCMDVCYDMVRLVGRWSGYLFYLELTSEGRLSFNIPIRSFPYGQYYYLLYDGVLSIYKYKDDSYAGDLFKISFISEDEVSVYSFVTREWYVLTRE